VAGVVGFYVNGADNTIGLLANPTTTTTPESPSLTPLATGLAGLGVVWRRCKST
jgi:hypothetical protein